MCSNICFVRLFGACLGLVFTCTVIIPRLVKLNTTASIFTRIVEVEVYNTSTSAGGFACLTCIVHSFPLCQAPTPPIHPSSTLTAPLHTSPSFAPPPPPALVRRQTSNRDVEVFLPSAEASMRFAFSQLSRLPPGGVKWPSQSPSGGSLAKKRLPGGGGPPGGAEVVSGVRFFFFVCCNERGRVEAAVFLVHSHSMVFFPTLCRSGACRPSTSIARRVANARWCVCSIDSHSGIALDDLSTATLLSAAPAAPLYRRPAVLLS